MSLYDDAPAPAPEPAELIVPDYAAAPVSPHMQTPRAAGEASSAAVSSGSRIRTWAHSPASTTGSVGCELDRCAPPVPLLFAPTFRLYTHT